MCRKNKVLAVVFISAGIGLLFGLVISGPFITAVLAGVLIVLGFLFLRR